MTRSSTTSPALSFARDGEDLTERYWPAAFHVLAKDILKFHAVIWPALLMAAGLEPPRGMVIHGYLLLGEKKMSKSLGNVLDPFEAIDRFGADALRFYCLREVSFGQDGAVSAPGFEAGTRPSSRTTSATSRAGRSRWSRGAGTASCPTRRSIPRWQAAMTG